MCILKANTCNGKIKPGRMMKKGAEMVTIFHSVVMSLFRMWHLNKHVAGKAIRISGERAPKQRGQ